MPTGIVIAALQCSHNCSILLCKLKRQHKVVGSLKKLFPKRSPMGPDHLLGHMKLVSYSWYTAKQYCISKYALFEHASSFSGEPSCQLNFGCRFELSQNSLFQYARENLTDQVVKASISRYYFSKSCYQKLLVVIKSLSVSTRL